MAIFLPFARHVFCHDGTYGWGHAPEVTNGELGPMHALWRGLLARVLEERIASNMRNAIRIPFF